MKTERITIPIFGLSCSEGGSLLAERALARLPGVTHVYVNPATETVYIEYDPGVCGADLIRASIERVGLKLDAPDYRATKSG